MMNELNFARVSHYILDRIIELNPGRFPEIFEKIFIALTGNKMIYRLVTKIYYHKIKTLIPFNKILIISEVNVGDAINMQESVNVLKFYFPDASIDFVCNKLAQDFLDLPDDCKVYGLFKQNQFPSEDDISLLNNLIEKKRYSIIINLSPGIKNSQLNSDGTLVQLFVPFVSYILRLRKLNNKIMSFSFSLHNFLVDMFNDFSDPKYLMGKEQVVPELKEKTINIPVDSIYFVEKFLKANNLSDKRGIIIFHTDTPSRFTQIPMNVQIQILKNILHDKNIKAVLLTTGQRTIELTLSIKSELPREYQDKVFIIPRMEISNYAALLDNADMVITGDTGIVHIVAAKRKAKAEQLRNQTALITIVGSSDSRIYGYESDNDKYLGTNQDAPAKIFESKAPCRNIACIDKIMKTCKETRCFYGINPDEISDYIIRYFSKRADYKPALGNVIPEEAEL